jgi:hypothetical protein
MNYCRKILRSARYLGATLKWILIMTTFGMSAARAATVNAPQSEAKLFEKPLIIGASVSADWASLSPGKRLALRYTKSSSIKTLAKPGHPSLAVLPTVPEQKLKDHSIVIGFDLFFWDSALPSATDSLNAMKKLIAATKASRVPLVLGDIPELLPGRQPSRRELNQMIHRSCKSEEHCYVIRLDELHKQVMRDRALTIKGRKYSFKELVPDGLHIGDVAGDFLADYVKESLVRK